MSVLWFNNSLHCQTVPTSFVCMDAFMLFWLWGNAFVHNYIKITSYKLKGIYHKVRQQIRRRKPMQQQAFPPIAYSC
jgi:hypothetical protein